MVLRLKLVESVNGNVQVPVKVGLTVRGDRLKVAERVPDSVRGSVSVSLNDAVDEARVRVMELLDVGGGVTVCVVVTEEDKSESLRLPVVEREIEGQVEDRLKLPVTEVVNVAVGGGVTVTDWVSDPEIDVEGDSDAVPQVSVGDGPVREAETVIVPADSVCEKEKDELKVMDPLDTVSVWVAVGGVVIVGVMVKLGDCSDFDVL